MKDQSEKKNGKNSLESEQVKTKSHPDGGWGWCVVMAAFLTQFVVVGLQNSSGVIFNELVQKFNRPRGETGLVSSISVGMMFILGPLTTSLCQRFGCRLISVLGGLLCMLGMILSAFAKTLTAMYFSFGITWGLGTSLCYFPTMIILVPYFSKRLSLVNGIVGAGSGVGTLVLSPCIQWFARTYGIENTFFMLAGLHSVVFFAGFVYRPISDEYKNKQSINVSEGKISAQLNTDSRAAVITEQNKQQKTAKISLYSDIISLFLDKAFVSWCLGLSVFILGYFVPFVHLVRFATLIGIPEVKAAFLISTLSITATIFKVISGKVAGMKQMNKLRMYQLTLLLIAISTTLVPITSSFIGLMFYVVVFGIGESCFVIMIPLITKEIVGVRRLPLALGCVFMIMAIPTIMGAPIAGWIYDYFNDYSIAFYVAGSMNTTGVLILFLVEYFRENKECENIIFGDGITSITQDQEILFIEENLQKTDSRVIEFTCLGSSQRIFYSEVETKELQVACQKHQNAQFESSSIVSIANQEPDSEGYKKTFLKSPHQHVDLKLNQLLPPFSEDRLSASCNHIPLIEKREISYKNRWSFIPENLQKINSLHFSSQTPGDKSSNFILKNGLSITFIEAFHKYDNKFSATKSSSFFIIEFPSTT